MQQDVCFHYAMDSMMNNLVTGFVSYLISPWTKMATIFLNKNDRIMIKISLKFVPRSPTDNKPVLVQVMAWCWIRHKPISETVLTQFSDAWYVIRGGLVE